jgi:YegS/Rv2252/BmrU family lipid kinase
VTGVLLVANAEAGSAEDERVEAAGAVLAAACDVEVARPEGADALADAVAGAQGRVVVLAGGDGTVHLAVRALLHRDPELLAATTLGLVPLGTGNDLANGLGIPDDPAEAARVCLNGTARRLDLVVTDTDDVVVNASHAGLGAAAAARSAGMKDALGPLAYPLGALIAGVREAAWDLTVTLDGEVIHSGRTLMVGIANGPSIGGGTRLVPPALPDDGLLDVLVVTAVGPAARLAFGAALRDEAHLDRDDVRHARGRCVTVAGDPVPHDLDGELTDDLPTCTYTVRPGAWQMLVRSGAGTRGR